MQKKKILITGAGGYIGSIASYIFLQNNYTVIGIDNFSHGYKQPLDILQKKYGKEKFRYYDIDIRDNLSPVLSKELDIDAVIHFAALCSVDESLTNPYTYFDINTNGTNNVLHYMHKFSINRIIFSSTCAVYGDPNTASVDETHPLKPLTPYSDSKKLAENILQWYNKIYGIDFVVLRYFNVCGATEDGVIGDSKRPSSLLVQNAVRAALGISPFELTCERVNTPDKTPIRDFINVEDLIEGHLKAHNYLIKGNKSTIVNLGTGRGYSVKEIIDEVGKKTKKKFKIIEGNKRKGEQAKVIASVHKAHTVLHWSPKKKLRQSIASLIKWYKRRPDGWAY